MREFHRPFYIALIILYECEQVYRITTYGTMWISESVSDTVHRSSQRLHSAPMNAFRLCCSDWMPLMGLLPGEVEFSEEK